MGLGEFRNRVILQSLSTSTDAGGGQYNESWGNSATVWAKVENLTGTENLFGDQLRGVSSYRFIIRYNSSITEKFRLSFNSKVFQINHIKNIYEGKNRYQEILANEGVAT